MSTNILLIRKELLVISKNKETVNDYRYADKIIYLILFWLTVSRCRMSKRLQITTILAKRLEILLSVAI